MSSLLIHTFIYFQKILNANDCDKAMKADIMGKLKNIQYTPDMVISTSSVSQIIAKSECGKSADQMK